MENIKVQITLPVETLDLLKRDAASFGFFWKNKKNINLNKLMNTIFANYLDTYNKNQKDINAEINDEIRELFDNTLRTISKDQKKSFEIPDNYKDELIHKIRLCIETKHLSGKIRTKETVRKEFGINKENEARYRSCRELIGSNSSYSEFFRKLFISYSSLSFDQRELIIFKTIANDLLYAIRSKKKVKITMDNKNLTLSPIALMPIDTDPSNYLFASSGSRRAPSYGIYQLSQIQFVEILDNKVDLPQDQIQFIKEAKHQIVITLEKSIVKVHFTEKGIKALNEMPSHIPTILHKDTQNRIYTFLCTIYEITILLIKLREDVIILEPSSIAIRAQENFCYNRDSHRAVEKFYNILEPRPKPPLYRRVSNKKINHAKNVLIDKNTSIHGEKNNTNKSKDLER